MLSRIVGCFEKVVQEMGLPVLGADDNPHSGAADDDDIEKTQSLMERLVHAMEQLTSVSKVPVLVIDGLEKITSVNQIRKASFLFFFLISLLFSY